ncbi:MAG: hypothetical protein ACE14P_00730 [Methanotrichaceae archaeon]
MFSKKMMMVLALAFAALSSVFVCGAYAQWLPRGTEINLGDFKLTSSLSQPGTEVYHIGRAPMAPMNAPANNLPTNNSSINSIPAINTQPAIIDLTGYARARAKGNLTGYTNIMYPLSESRGTTTTTGGGGCGCGG